MKDVNVSIRGISILTSVNWTIKEGERWLLKGPNGSGKSTVLSLLVGDHPQSYVQPVELFGRQRVDIATSTLQSNLGQISPEIFNAFPRKMTPGAMNGLDAVVTGFHDIFIYRKATSEQTARVHQLAQYFQVPDAVMQGLFAEASPAYQALLLFMRAIVKQPSLLVLECVTGSPSRNTVMLTNFTSSEPFSGMTERMVSACKQYIDEELRPDQALVLVTHYPEDERPASVDSLIEIQDGSIVNEEQM